MMTNGPELIVYIGAPGFEPGTSPTRTVRATRLRHAPRAAIIPERGVEAMRRLGRAGRYFAPVGRFHEGDDAQISCSWSCCWRCWRLPPVGAGLPAAGLHRHLAAERRQRQGLRADAGSGDRQRAAAALLGGVQAKAPAFAEPDWDGFDHEVDLAAEAEIRVMPFVWGSPDWVAPELIDLPVRSAWQRWGWAASCAKRSGATGRTAPSGKKTRSCRSCRSSAGRSGTRRTSSPSPTDPTRRASRADPDLRPRSCTASTPAPR